MAVKYTLPRCMRREPPIVGPRRCRGCLSTGPFRSTMAEVCIGCDEAQREWRKEYQATYGCAPPVAHYRGRSVSGRDDRPPDTIR